MGQYSDSEYINVLGAKVKTKYISILITILLVALPLFAVSIPGHWNEKVEYETKLYVNLFPDSRNAKNYRLIGDIQKTRECDGSEDLNDCIDVYRVTKITFLNGGYIEFDECIIESPNKNYCVDTNENEWYVELTDKKP